MSTQEQELKDKVGEETFTNIDPDTLSPELQEIYKTMQAGFTKKTQAFAEREKGFLEKEQKWEEGLKTMGAVEEENKKWHTWYEGLEDSQESTKEEAKTDPLESLKEDNPDIRAILSAFQETQSTQVNNLTQELESLKSTVKQTNDQTSRMFNYQSQLGELAEQYEGLDKQAVLDHALKIGQPDLKKAYSDLYHEDLISQEVEKRVQEELEKQRTQGIRASAQQVIVRSKQNAPKSFAEATEQILNS